MAKPWLLVGISHRLTEPFKKRERGLKPISRLFRKSLGVFVIDTGNNNTMNLEIRALTSPQYNIHRFGIHLVDTPRHADVLLVLGPILQSMLTPLQMTIQQIPEPFGVILIEPKSRLMGVSAEIPNLIARYDRNLSASEILAILLGIMEEK